MSDIPPDSGLSPMAAALVGKRRNAEKYTRSLVPAWLAAIFSLIIPGLGQLLAGAWRRGLLVFFSFIAIGGLMWWRLTLAAPRDTGFLNITRKAFHLQPFFIPLTILFVILFVWIATDAYLIARRATNNTVLLMVLIVALFFGLGWQIGEINPVTVVTKAGDAGPALGKVLWPWPRAITRPEDIRIVPADIQVPCTDTPLEATKATAEQPYLVASPTCGTPSEQGGAQGTKFTLNGFNFDPSKDVEIWWKDPLGNAFRQRTSGKYLTMTPDAQGNFQVDVIMPYRLIPEAGGQASMWQVQGRQLAAVGAPEPSQELILAITRMIETIFIGMMATLFGIILSVPISFLAARNLMGGSPITMGIYYITRTIMNLIRSIEPLIWAIIAVIVVGLGPFAGILALTLHSIAALGKLYSEAIESIDNGPIEAIHATGANWLQTVMYAVVPQIIPPFVSFTIYRWDINIRMSTIIGFVGGGGIGFLLAQWIRLLDYQAAGIAVWFIAITVALLDYISAEIRARYV